MGDSVPIIAITGKKNSGKTTVIESMVQIMTKKGWKVGTVKHHHFGDFEPDTPGKDSFRHYQAGAVGVVLASPKKLAYFEPVSERPEVEELLRFFPQNTSLIFLEGFHHSGYPRIEVSRKEISETLLSEDVEQLIAIVADYDSGKNVMKFSFDKLEELGDYLDTFLKA